MSDPAEKGPDIRELAQRLNVGRTTAQHMLDRYLQPPDVAATLAPWIVREIEEWQSEGGREWVSR